MSSSLNSALNILVLVGLCVVGYFVFKEAHAPIGPPDDAWFRTAVVDRPEPVLVKFGAEWCGPCRAMEPELDQFANKVHGEVGVVRIDVDKHPELARHYGVSSIPRVMLFRHGKVVADRVGYADTQQLQSWVASYAQD